MTTSRKPQSIHVIGLGHFSTQGEAAKKLGIKSGTFSERWRKGHRTKQMLQNPPRKISSTVQQREADDKKIGGAIMKWGVSQ